jgi:F-type H+-transporting ATPase subunit gamma
MALRLADVELQLHNLHELQDIVGAMRAVAAIRVQEAQAALDGTRAYAEVIGAAIAEALPLLPAPPRRPAALPGAPMGTVLFMAEHGFTGAFNDQLADALGGAGERGADLFVVGGRGRALLEERGLRPAFATDMATHVGAVTDTARRIAGALYQRFERGRLATVEIVFFRHQGGGRRSLERQSLLPVDLEAFGSSRAAAPPLTNLAPATLIEGLIEEYLFAELAHAAMESFASENGARLATMQSARDKLDQRLLELGALESRLRQEQITDELLEIITGTEAVR